MAEDGYRDIMNVDYSEACIARLLAERTDSIANEHADRSQHVCQYRVADCRSMPEFADALFASVIDKGTIDGTLCGGKSVDNAIAILQEIGRVLQDGGVFLLITYGAPTMRHKYLLECGVPWSIETYTAAKVTLQELLLKGEEPAAKEVAIDGPLTDEQLEGLNMADNVYFVYVCHKRGNKHVDG